MHTILRSVVGVWRIDRGVNSHAVLGVDARTGVVPPPRVVVARLNALINEGLAGVEVTTALAKLYALPKSGSPADFSASSPSNGQK
jgi:hypothetical protein